MQNTNLVEKKSKKKTLAAVLVLLLAVALLVGCLFAFFSDKLEGEGNLEAGTLEIESIIANEPNGFVIERFVSAGNWEKCDVSATESAHQTIINPGDIFRIRVEVKNQGSKSTHLGAAIDLNFKPDGNTDEQTAELKKHTKLYSEFDENTKALTKSVELIAKSEGNEDLQTVENGIHMGILDGTKEFEEGRAEASAQDTYKGDILYFTLDKTTSNVAQKGKIDFDVVIKAVQYRNNTTAPADWTKDIKELDLTK